MGRSMNELTPLLLAFIRFVCAFLFHRLFVCKFLYVNIQFIYLVLCKISTHLRQIYRFLANVQSLIAIGGAFNVNIRFNVKHVMVNVGYDIFVQMKPIRLLFWSVECCQYVSS